MLLRTLHMSPPPQSRYSCTKKFAEVCMLEGESWKQSNRLYRTTCDRKPCLALSPSSRVTT
eukprot:scaffold155726_cov15-Tisochrysis_lutea.AAC.1